MIDDVYVRQIGMNKELPRTSTDHFENFSLTQYGKYFT